MTSDLPPNQTFRRAVLHSGANFSSVKASIPSCTTHLLLQNEIPLPSTTSYLKLAKASSKSIITLFNPSPMPSKAELQAFPWELVDWLLLNEGEAKDIVEALDSTLPPQTTTSTVNTPQETRHAVDAISRLSQHPRLARTNTVCTLGALGVLVLEPTDGVPVISYYPSAPLRNPLKDTTGAGDCFAGYFVAGLMKMKSGLVGKDAMDMIVRDCLTVSLSILICYASQSLMNPDRHVHCASRRMAQWKASHIMPM
jgi:ribokinase